MEWGGWGYVGEEGEETWGGFYPHPSVFEMGQLMLRVFIFSITFCEVH